VTAPAALSLATCVVDDPTGYGRILRKTGRVVEIREHRDLKAEAEHAIREINAGIYAANVTLLKEAVANLVPNNVQEELYLTDIVAIRQQRRRGRSPRSS